MNIPWNIYNLFGKLTLININYFYFNHQKVMNQQGSMKLCHVNESIMEILEVTGFVDILTIE